MFEIGPFRGPWYFLSNFFPCPVSIKGEGYSSVEHAYQASKCVYPEDRKRVRLAESAGQAKRLAEQCEHRSDWFEVRDQIMLDLLRQKFAAPPLQQELLRSGTARLVEKNDWGDTYWGVCDGVGRNRLGDLLEQVRNEVRSLTRD